MIARLKSADVVRTDHSDVPSRRIRARCLDLNFDHSPSPAGQARVRNFRARIVGLERGQEVDQAMHPLPRTHEPISQIRMLIQHALRPAKAKLIPMLALLQGNSRSRILQLRESRLKHDLRRRAAEIEHGIRHRRPRRIRPNRVQQIVRRHPRKHTLVPAVHDRDRLLRRQRERVHRSQPSPHRVQYLRGLRGAQQAQARRRLDRDGRAAAERLGHGVHRGGEQLVEALRRLVRASGVCGQARLPLHERLVLVRGRGPAVVELVDVDARARRAGVNHERILHQRQGRAVRRGAENGSAGIWVRLVGGRSGRMGTSWRDGWGGRSGRMGINRCNRWSG